MQHGTFSRRDIAAWQQESPSFRAGRMSTAYQDVEMVYRTYGKFISEDYQEPKAQLRIVK
jgi:ketol-acid reductoisomerase